MDFVKAHLNSDLDVVKRSVKLYENTLNDLPKGHLSPSATQMISKVKNQYKAVFENIQDSIKLINFANSSAVNLKEKVTKEIDERK